MMIHSEMSVMHALGDKEQTKNTVTLTKNTW